MDLWSLKVNLFHSYQLPQDMKTYWWPVTTLYYANQEQEKQMACSIVIPGIWWIRRKFVFIIRVTKTYLMKQWPTTDDYDDNDDDDTIIIMTAQRRGRIQNTSSISLLKSDRMSNCDPRSPSHCAHNGADSCASNTTISADINFNRVTCLPTRRRHELLPRHHKLCLPSRQ